MAKKISLWISTILYPITKSPILDSRPKDPGSSDAIVPWPITDRNAETVTVNSPELDRKSEYRKESIGSGAVVRERLIKDLE